MNIYITSSFLPCLLFSVKLIDKYYIYDGLFVVKPTKSIEEKVAERKKERERESAAVSEKVI